MNNYPAKGITETILSQKNLLQWHKMKGKTGSINKLMMDSGLCDRQKWQLL